MDILTSIFPTVTSCTPLIVNGLGCSSQRAALLAKLTGILETVFAVFCNGTISWLPPDIILTTGSVAL
ncbi:hypothetical protein TCE0_023f07271 [Talaromyces pinophilus]|uniref:Uncharacterized protein n=1 Tax=Talaromyces pinophilus TaxID=128442 RepID=A0A0B8N3E6_TALPI|nr:hypothetical protein TCE0_023f07271 [Talaromyces pinophilus]